MACVIQSREFVTMKGATAPGEKVDGQGSAAKQIRKARLLVLTECFDERGTRVAACRIPVARRANLQLWAAAGPQKMNDKCD